MHQPYQTEQDTPIYRIYNSSYHYVYMKSLYARDAWDMDNFSRHNESDDNETIYARISVASMADILAKGGTFVLATPKESGKAIYNLVMEFFRHVEYCLLDANGAGNIPSIQDRSELAALVEEVYPIAKTYNERDRDETDFEKYVRMYTMGLGGSPVESPEETKQLDGMPGKDRRIISGIELALSQTSY